MDKLLTTKEAAWFLGVSPAFLERDRWAGAEIPFVRVGSRAVRYQLSELEAFVLGFASQRQPSAYGRENAHG